LILEAINKYNSSLKEADKGERGVPVPEVYALCMDKEVVGAGFYVMEFLEGRVFQNIFMKEVNGEDRRAWYGIFHLPSILFSAVDLVRIH
jgi:aminoglycoside phosphotransferase (APT) family kinase protein